MRAIPASYATRRLAACLGEPAAYIQRAVSIERQGGNFAIQAGGLGANNIARWNGSNWSPLGGGLNGSAHACLLDPDGRLVVGGMFTQAGGSTANNLAVWDPSSQTWSSYGSGLDGEVTALAFDARGSLYIGGRFAKAGGQNASCITRWDGSRWSALGSGLYFNPSSISSRCSVSALLLMPDGDLYVGGTFEQAGGKVSNGFAIWHPAKVFLPVVTR